MWKANACRGAYCYGRILLISATLLFLALPALAADGKQAVQIQTEQLASDSR